MAYYDGQVDLYELAEGLDAQHQSFFDASTHKVHHGDEQSNFGTTDFGLIEHGESNNLTPPGSVQPLSPFASKTSLGTRFVDNAPSANVNSLDDKMLDDFLNGLTDAETEYNLNPDQSQPSNKSCQLDEGIQNLHDTSYEQQYDEAGTSGTYDNHVEQLVAQPELQQGYLLKPVDNSQVAIIDNSENVPTTTIKCPRTKTSFEVSNTDLAKFLREKGRKQTEEPQLSDIEIKQLIRRFCIPREMNFVGLDDAKRLVKACGDKASSFKIKRVEKKTMKKTTKKTTHVQAVSTDASEHYKCLLCPLTQNEERSFSRKEDLKRHYHQHLSFVRFECNFPGCSYKISRVDHMKTHMNNCHGGSSNFTKHD